MLLSSPTLSLASAAAIVDGTLFVGRANTLAPLTVCVLDAGGHLIAFKREDGSSILRENIARGKAFGALGMGLDSRDLASVADQRPAFMNAAFAASEGRIVPAAGGVLILDPEGKRVVGAVGVSGDLSDKDEACAIAAVRALGLSCKAIEEGRKCALLGHTKEQVQRFLVDRRHSITAKL